ncbi:MAG: glycosyltransferase family 2 protein [Eubacterium sp.]|nr:glycosyltransferase family 2 protein [Eubacterium sp.]
MKLSIVVPCYDEAENIPLILKRFQAAIHRADIEVILVDNGSRDNTQDVLAALLPKYSFAKSIYVKVNRGYGYGIVQGLKVCQGKFIGWTHADMQTDPADLLKVLHIIEKYHEDEMLFVKGTRFGRPLSDRIFTVGMSIFETAYLRVKLQDINAQPNVFSRKFFDTWQNPPKDFALDLYALYMAQKQNLNIRRFPVVFPQRIHGASHWNHGLAAKGRFIKRTLVFSRKLKKGGIC